MSDNDTHPERPDQSWQPAPDSAAPAPSAGYPAESAGYPAAEQPGAGTPPGDVSPTHSWQSPAAQQPTPPVPPVPPVPSGPPAGQPVPGYPAPTGPTSSGPVSSAPASGAPGQGYPYANYPTSSYPGASGTASYPAAGSPYGQPSGYPGRGYPPAPGYPAGHAAPGYATGHAPVGQPGAGQSTAGQSTVDGQPVLGPDGQPIGPSGYGSAHGVPPYGGYPQQPYYGGGQPAQRRGFGRVIATGVLALLLAGGGGVVGGLVVHAADDNNGGTSTSAPRGATQVLDRSSLASVVANVKASVVDISTKSGEGSGIVLDSNGYIVTNNHVVADAGGTVNVHFSDGSTSTAKVIGTDARTDIGVVKVSDTKNLSPAKFGDSSALQVGDTVVAIGSPLGLEGSVTAGIVSALNRTIDESDSNGQSTGVAIAGAIQTDAAINPGNSGGALVNLSGEVVGINTAILTSGQGEGNIGVGFAIPGNRANQVAQAIIKGQKVSHPYIGITVGTADNTSGAQVGSVVSGSPADQAGLKQGDVITKAGDKAIHTSDDLLNVVQSAKVGDKIQLTVQRAGSATTVTVTIGEAPN